MVKCSWAQTFKGKRSLHNTATRPGKGVSHDLWYQASNQTDQLLGPFDIIGFSSLVPVLDCSTYTVIEHHTWKRHFGSFCSGRRQLGVSNACDILWHYCKTTLCYPAIPSQVFLYRGGFCRFCAAALLAVRMCLVAHSSVIQRSAKWLNKTGTTDQVCSQVEQYSTDVAEIDNIFVCPGYGLKYFMIFWCTLNAKQDVRHLTNVAIQKQAEERGSRLKCMEKTLDSLDVICNN